MQIMTTTLFGISQTHHVGFLCQIWENWKGLRARGILLKWKSEEMKM